MRLNEAINFEYVSDSSTSLQSNNNSEFGNFQDTGDWVECESRSFPGRTYFFNMRTLCTTWARPVSRNVTLPRYRERFQKMYDKNFTHDIDNQSTIVSSESADNLGLPITTSGHNLRRSPSEIIAWLYHSSDINMNDCFNDDQSDHKDSFVSDTLEVLCEKEDPRSVYKESAFYEVGDHFLTNNYEFDKIRILNGVVQNVAPTADYLEVKLSTSNDAIKSAKQSGLANEDDDTLIVEKCFAYSSSSSENCHSAELVPNYFAPRLPRIKLEYLLTDKLRVGRKRKVSKKKSIRKTPRKIVCEMYGTKTINYDPVELDLPPGVKRTNLSDSSATSSLWRQEHAEPPVNFANFQLADFGLRTYNLSSDSTTSSSCSSCTCSSTSSNASQKSSSNTYNREEK